MKIVVLDGHTLNPGDLSWGPFESLGELTVHARTAPDQTVARARNADLVLTNKTVLDADTIGSLDGLRYIGVLATGYNVVDTDAAAARGIPVTHVPEYGTASVAQFVMAHVLNLAQRVGGHAAAVRAGRWSQSPDFCFWDGSLLELDGLTMGIIGFGRIGRATARLAQAFGMTVLTVDRRRRPDGPSSVRSVPLDELLRVSDVVSLSCPLTEETANLIDARRLALMKPTALLINTSRGGVVDEAALADALRARRLAGAGLDVLSREPPPADHPLLAIDTCYVTPHLAWGTRAARERLLAGAAANVAAFLQGRPRHVVNARPGLEPPSV